MAIGKRGGWRWISKVGRFGCADVQLKGSRTEADPATPANRHLPVLFDPQAARRQNGLQLDETNLHPLIPI